MAASTKTVTAKKAQSLNNYLIIVALVTLMVFVAAIIVGKGLVGQLVQSQRLIGQKQHIRDTLTADQTAISSLQDAYSKLAPSVTTELADALPETTAFPELSALLAQLSGASGVQTTSVTASAVGSTTAASDSVSSYGVNVSLIASYAGLQQYFHNLEISVRPLRVTQVSFSGSGPSLNAQINLTAYYQSGVGAQLFDQTEAFK